MGKGYGTATGSWLETLFQALEGVFANHPLLTPPIALHTVRRVHQRFETKHIVGRVIQMR